MPTPTADLIARARRDADLLDARHAPASSIAATLREAAARKKTHPYDRRP